MHLSIPARFIAILVLPPDKLATKDHSLTFTQRCAGAGLWEPIVNYSSQLSVGQCRNDSSGGSIYTTGTGKHYKSRLSPGELIVNQHTMAFSDG